MEEVVQKIDELKEQLQESIQLQETTQVQEDDDEDIPLDLDQGFVETKDDEDNRLYWTDNHWRHVPPNFVFPPKCKLDHAWNLWLIGSPNFEAVTGQVTPVRPYRMFKSGYLPKKNQPSLGNQLVSSAANYGTGTRSK